ncbi:hypothetical protein M896_090600 [Ordospora colligata OC4]|uniref:Uncharacterized protein n=1 Tax=Ordospora colligata OC4 TaxID=1354746 RepID=A0A0B2UJH8_9MICR|nr:uncharacterized protein M896_090600 [Ordospora colligata OC4]KHN69135.1 hypothetical protein M896_090600 [Ordospora colligata OC4]
MDAKVYKIVKEEGNVEERMRKILSLKDSLGCREAVAYLLKESMSLITISPEIHLNVLSRIPTDVVGNFMPGLLSFYFTVLKDVKTRAEVRRYMIQSMEHVMESVDVFDAESERRIYEFLYFNRNQEYKNAYYVCYKKLKNEGRAFFASELLLLGHQLEEDDYDIINSKAVEVFSPRLVSRLLEIGRYVHSDEVFDMLVKMYERGEEVHRIIYEIQRMYGIRRVLELCVVNEENTLAVLHTNSIEKIERYLAETDWIPMHVEVVGKYLEICESTEDVVDSMLFRRMGVQRMVSEHYDELIEYGTRILATNAQVLINLIGIELRPRISDAVIEVVELLSETGSLCILSQQLYFVKEVVEKRCMRRSTLRRIFDGLVYLDNADYRVRCMKYEIIAEILDQYALMDMAIERRCSARDGFATEVNEADNTMHKTCDVSAHLNIYDVLADSKCVDDDNVNVLVAILWNEITTIPVEGEIKAICILVGKIIDVSGKFIESRIVKSGFIQCIMDQQKVCGFNETKRNAVEALIRLLEIMMSYELTKPMFYKVFVFLLEYFHVLDVTHLLEAMIRNDKYYCLLIYHQLYVNACKVPSKQLKVFLIKNLRKK